jgi:hypothetical protein
MIRNLKHCMDYQKKAWCQNIKEMHEVEFEILKPNQHKILWSKKKF